MPIATVRSARLIVTLSVLLGSVACNRSAHTADSQQTPESPVPTLTPVQAPRVATDTSRVPSPTVAIGCVLNGSRTGFAEVRWPTVAGVLPESVSVDFTVFKDGFQADRYASFAGSPSVPKIQIYFRPEAALTAMSVRSISRRRDGETTTLRVEQLDPGVNYLFRLRLNVNGQVVVGAPVRVQAPTCISDTPEERHR